MHGVTSPQAAAPAAQLYILWAAPPRGCFQAPPSLVQALTGMCLVPGQCSEFCVGMVCARGGVGVGPSGTAACSLLLATRMTRPFPLPSLQARPCRLLLQFPSPCPLTTFSVSLHRIML